jgi:serine protease
VPVAGIDQSGAKAPTSNYGNSVSLSAPSTKIPVLNDEGKLVPGLPVAATVSGTSFAAPEVAGVAAMMLGKNPNLTADNISRRLYLSARPFPNAANCAGCGVGIVDATRALDSAQAITTKTEPNDSESTANYISGPADVTATFNSTPDFYRVDVPPGQTVLLNMQTTDPDYNCFMRPATDLRPFACKPPSGSTAGWKNTTSSTRSVSIALGGKPGLAYTINITWH